MQDYPHYKYRPRRKKKDKTGTNQPKGSEGTSLEGQSKRQSQPPEPAYLQRVATAAAVAAAANSSKDGGEESNQQRLIRFN